MRRFAVLVCLCSWVSPAQAEEVQIGGFIIPGSPAATLFYDYAERLAADSNGSLEPQLLIHGEGGPEEQILSGVRRGRIKIASLSSLVLSNIVPEIAYLGAPFLFDTKEEFDYVVDTVFFELFGPLMQERGLTVMRWLDLGGQNIYATKPILWPKDAVGMRLRSTQDIAARMFLESIGADVIYITSPETIPGLQTGMIDGGLTPTVAYTGTGLVSEAPHFNLTQHFFLGGFLLANTKWLEGLTDREQRIIIDTFASTQVVRQTIAGMNAAGLASAAEEGFTAHSFSAEQRAAWKAASVGTHGPLMSEIGGRTQDVADAIQVGRAAYAAGAR
ncbi:MAG: TRAP transporter substrate-binding protein [Rhodospirillaceae bacterium]|nr:TRAP transporter substrate-binding protein [Rhodospirillaceae bacterium]